jgi:hypothetical protein
MKQSLNSSIKSLVLETSKNITFTLAKHHQQWLTNQIISGNMFKNDITRGPITRTSCLSQESQHTTSSILQKGSRYNLDSLILLRLKWIKINSVKYMPNNCYLILSVTDSEPVFAKLSEIFLINSNDLFFEWYIHRR